MDWNGLEWNGMIRNNEITAYTFSPIAVYIYSALQEAILHHVTGY